MSAINKEELKKTLNEEATRLRKELSNLKASKESDLPQQEEIPPAEFPDREEQEDRSEAFETELSEIQTLRSRLEDVERALLGIDNPEYGVCKTCGKPIPEARLQVNPAAEYDIEHEPNE